MSSSFPMVPLRQVLKHRSEFIEIDDFQTYKRCRVQLHTQGIVERDTVPGVEIRTKKQQVCYANEFLVAEIDAKVGGFGIVPKELEGAVVSSHYFLFSVDDEQLERRFLEFYTCTPYFMEQVRAKGSTNYAAIRPKDVLGYVIPLPPLEEQRRIVARIEEVAAKIEEAQGLRREAVEEAEMLLASALKSLFDDKSQQWSYKKLAEDDLAIVVAGQHIMAAEYNALGEGFPYITGPADFGSKVPVIRRWTQTPKSTAKPGDVLLTVKGAGVGKINFAPDVEIVIGRQIMAIRPNSDYLLQEFLYFFLQHKFEHFQSIATATTVPGFKKTDVEELSIPFPALSEQQDIINYLDNQQTKVDLLKHHQAETSAELNALLPSILDKAFKGEL